MNFVQLVTPREVAANLRLSVPTVYRMITRGEIEAIRIGGQYRVRAEVVRKLLERTVHEPAPAA